MQKMPKPLRRRPEDRDAAEREVLSTGAVKDLDGEVLNFKRLVIKCDALRTTIQEIKAAPRAALEGFAAFLLSPTVKGKLQSITDAPKSLAEIAQAGSEAEAAEVLLTLPARDLKALAKLLAAVVGDKRPKGVHMVEFSPTTVFIWDEKDIELVVEEFRTFLKNAWSEGFYIKIE
jgi:hypothetical protein